MILNKKSQRKSEIKDQPNNVKYLQLSNRITYESRVDKGE